MRRTRRLVHTSISTQRSFSICVRSPSSVVVSRHAAIDFFGTNNGDDCKTRTMMMQHIQHPRMTTWATEEETRRLRAHLDAVRAIERAKKKNTNTTTIEKKKNEKKEKEKKKKKPVEEEAEEREEREGEERRWVSALIARAAEFTRAL